MKNTSVLYHELDRAVETYRENLMKRRSALIPMLCSKVKQLDSLDLSADQIKLVDSLNQTIIQELGYLSNDVDLYNLTAKDSKLIAWREEYLSVEAKLIAAHYKLKDLIYSNILQSEYPYDLETDSSRYRIYAELSGIPPEAKILDVGTGVGAKMIVMAIWRPEQDITVNEVDESYIKFLKYELKQIAEICPNIKVLSGTKKSIGETSEQYDVVTMINTFHHMKHKKKMVKSIKAHLSESGQVWLYEGVIEYKVGESICAKMMSGKELYDSVEKVHLRVIDTVHLPDQGMVLLKCTL